MFRVSRRVDYGLKLLVALAADQDSGAQATSRLASRLDIPLAFLHQIGRSLIQAGILRSSPGPGGGLRLNQPADEISLLHVLEVLDGPVRLSSCLDQPDNNGHDDSWAYHQAWSCVQETLVKELKQIRISAIAKQVKATDKAYIPAGKFETQSGAYAV